ncbi:MAG TPA: histidine kinase dimerization/phospho-acceptor domain-containing protein [Acidimicrobiales bacterium]|nr:histidine kinase dimerization/phospho-acceptor domain-containing protein [Acidimicrobiales bacterium]
MSETDDELIAVVAHGLLNSIASIRINADLLRRSAELSSDQQEMIEAIEVQSKHVGAVLVDLTRVAGPELLAQLDKLQRGEPGRASTD